MGGKLKTFNVRMEKELWVFLKKLSIQKEMSMNDIIINRVKKLRDRKEKKLTSHDAMV